MDDFSQLFQATVRETTQVRLYSFGERLSARKVGRDAYFLDRLATVNVVELSLATFFKLHDS